MIVICATVAVLDHFHSQRSSYLFYGTQSRVSNLADARLGLFIDLFLFCSHQLAFCIDLNTGLTRVSHIWKSKMLAFVRGTSGKTRSGVGVLRHCEKFCIFGPRPVVVAQPVDGLDDFIGADTLDGEPPDHESLIGQKKAYTAHHPILDGTPCDIHGNDLPANTPPPARPSANDPANFTLHRRARLTTFERFGLPLSKNPHSLTTMTCDTSGENVVPWKLAEYEVWTRNPRTLFRNQLANPDFEGEIDYSAKQVFNEGGKREWKDLMSGNWAWEQSDIIAEDEETHGAMFVPAILGSDKTIVSVATGQNEYYPLYGSIGNVHNNVRRAHRNAVSVLGFLAIPKTNRQYKDDPAFHKFCRQLFHASLTTIFEPLRAAMTTPEVTRCPDGHFRRIIYGLGPYITDYPEQMYSTMLWDEYGIVGNIMPFTSSFPRADIHQLLSPDLLHQIIKGTFKDHLVSWVGEYLDIVHSATRAASIMADIDRRIAAVPAFLELRRFPEGRSFKQWTGDDSKALMKVYLPAIAGHVPPQMVRALSAFLDFCYLSSQWPLLVNHGVETHQGHKGAMASFKPFCGTRADAADKPTSRQARCVSRRLCCTPSNVSTSSLRLTSTLLHAICLMVPAFCYGFIPFNCRLIQYQKMSPTTGMKLPTMTTMTELLKDLKSWRKSLWQKQKRDTTHIGLPRLRSRVKQPRLPELVRRFLFDQLYPDAPLSASEIPLSECPVVRGRISVFHSAVAIYYAPSDPSGIGGMHKERIRATPLWRGTAPRRDCVFAEKDARCGLAGHARPPCLQWFIPVGDEPCQSTGMWVIQPDITPDGSRITSIIHVDSIVRGAHLIGVYGNEFLPYDFHYTDSLDAFRAYYVNKFIDHHANEIAF
ncbi:hypothetical protein EW146_g1774 [Bondarzewia mesenterica]|uniref:Uncharacterized protein n=1 Tax=Bondarzewia mesenterica TaxID=1095465 RepID=A0A4S4M2Q7_9AGAM|nr:hypothetical protein EW146_g1774 [Bondarzewia mesenterica]